MASTFVPLNCKLDDVKARLPIVDAFVCCASFEERCLSVAKALGLNAKCRVVVGRFDQRPGLTNQHFEALKALGEGSARELPLKLSDPVATADSIISILKSLNEGGVRSVVIDVSTFTHEVTLILYRLIPELFDPNCNVVFVYTGANEYSVGDDPKNKWLSRGIREVRSVIGYPGDMLPSQTVHLVLLAGFEYERAIGLIRELEPSHVSLGCGDGSVAFTEPHQPTNEQTMAAIHKAQSIASEVDLFSFDPYSPDSVCSAVAEQCQKVSGMSTVIAAMNTKLSTLGVARCAVKFQRVQVCYAQPLVYNYEKYSTPRDDVWIWKA